VGKYGRAVVAECNVTDRREHFALLVDRDLAVFLRRAVKPPDRGARKRSNGIELDSTEHFIPGQSREDFNGIATIRLTGFGRTPAV
jgi:hypothetical protein